MQRLRRLRLASPQGLRDPENVTMVFILSSLAFSSPRIMPLSKRRKSKIAASPHRCKEWSVVCVPAIGQAQVASLRWSVASDSLFQKKLIAAGLATCQRFFPVCTCHFRSQIMPFCFGRPQIDSWQRRHVLCFWWGSQGSFHWACKSWGRWRLEIAETEAGRRWHPLLQLFFCWRKRMSWQAWIAETLADHALTAQNSVSASYWKHMSCTEEKSRRFFLKTPVFPSTHSHLAMKKCWGKQVSICWCANRRKAAVC